MEVNKVNPKLVVLAGILVALLVAPLVAAAPLLGQNNMQNSNALPLQDQQCLQTGSCPDATAPCEPSQNPACQQDCTTPQSPNCNMPLKQYDYSSQHHNRHKSSCR